MDSLLECLDVFSKHIGDDTVYIKAPMKVLVNIYREAACTYTHPSELKEYTLFGNLKFSLDIEEEIKTLENEISRMEKKIAELKKIG